MLEPQDKLLLQLTQDTHKAVVKAMQGGSNVDDVANTLRNLANSIQYAGKLHREVTGKDMNFLP